MQRSVRIMHSYRLAANRQAIHHQEVILNAAFGMYHAFI